MNQKKKYFKSNSKSFIYGTKEEDTANIEMELFEGIAFYIEEVREKTGIFHYNERRIIYR